MIENKERINQEHIKIAKEVGLKVVDGEYINIGKKENIFVGVSDDKNPKKGFWWNIDYNGIKDFDTVMENIWLKADKEYSIKTNAPYEKRCEFVEKMSKLKHRVMELEKTKENEMNPVDKRKMLEKEINNYKQSNDNDFLQQKDAYVGLNYALAKAHDYDATKENKYMNKIKEIEEPLKSISQRTEFSEDDPTKKILTPNKEDEKLMNLFKENNYSLYKEANQELKMMNKEKDFFQMVQNTSNINQLVSSYHQLENGSGDTRMNHAIKEGNEINTQRFKNHYPKATKKLEEAYLKFQKQEKNNDKGIEL